MKKTILFLLVGGTTAVTALSRAQESPPPPHGTHSAPADLHAHLHEETARFHEEMAQLMKGAMEKAAALEAEGKKDEAAEVRAHAEKKQQSAIKEHQRTMQEKNRRRLKQEHAERERAGREHTRKGQGPQAERLKRRPPPAQADQPPPGHHYGSTAPEKERRLHHVEQAVKHLRQAGLIAPARNLERLAERLRHTRPHRPGPARHDRPGAARPNELESLRQEVRELKKSMEQWRKDRPQDGAPPTAGQSPEKHH